MKIVVRILLCALFSSIFIAPVSNAASDTALSATTASAAATLITCTDLTTQKTVVLKKSQKSCRPLFATAIWHMEQSDSSAHTGAGYASLRTCSSKRAELSYQLIKSKCAKYQVTNNYWRSAALPAKPVIAQASSYSHEGVFLKLASESATNTSAPIAYYTIISSKGDVEKVNSWQGLSVTMSGLRSATSYTFTITATSVDGTSLVSAPSLPVTTQTYLAPVAAATSAPLAAPAFTLSSSSETRTVNTAATGFTIATSTGGAIASFAISATPAGKSFSTSTGALTGTPTTVASATAYTITATNASGSATQTFTLTVSPGAATKAMMTTQPAGAVSGSAFTTQPVVRVTDSGGNTVTTSTAVVTVSKASGSGTLSGTTTATAIAGVATFTNLVITGTGDHVLTFTPATLTAVNSETFTVSLAAQATLSITSLTTSTKAHSYSQALSITTSGGSGTGATTFAIASGGTATTCTLSNSTATATITATTVGTCLIQATKAADATYASTTSATATFTFQVGAATKAMMTTQPAGAVNGSAFTTQPVVRVTDSGDNTVTSFTGNVVASIASGTGTLSGTTTATAVAGVATFTNLVITGTAGNFTLTFTPASLTAVTSSSFALAAGAATKVAITRASVGTTDNVAFTTQPQITIQDASGNTVSSSADVTATISGAGGTLIGTTTATALFGVATFTGLGIDGTPGTAYTITYTVSGLTVATAAVTVALTCAAGGTCSVGDTGPGGGKIFYKATTPFACGPTRSATCTYLEAAPALWFAGLADPTRRWAKTTHQNTAVNNATSPETATATAIGWGYRNTRAIILQGNSDTATSAAALADSHTVTVSGVVYDDWFLPSKDELAQLYSQKATVGVFMESTYWSSSEDSEISAWDRSFGDGSQGSAWNQTFTNGSQRNDNDKVNSLYVRPVRAF
jgi:hypothetical protein